MRVLFRDRMGKKQLRYKQQKHMRSSSEHLLIQTNCRSSRIGNSDCRRKRMLWLNAESSFCSTRATLPLLPLLLQNLPPV